MLVFGVGGAFRPRGHCVQADGARPNIYRNPPTRSVLPETLLWTSGLDESGGAARVNKDAVRVFAVCARSPAGVR